MNGRSIRINRLPATIVAILLTFVLVYFLNFHQEERPAIYGMLRSENPSRVNLRKMLIAAIQAAQRGGLEVLDVARSRQLKERSKGKTDEGVNDPFTDADGRSHCVMKQGLQRIFPRVQIFSEEDKEHCKQAHGYDLDPTVLHETAQIPDVTVNAQDVTVWVDPLDATKEFTGEDGFYSYLYFTMVCSGAKFHFSIHRGTIRVRDHHGVRGSGRKAHHWRDPQPVQWTNRVGVGGQLDV